MSCSILLAQSTKPNAHIKDIYVYNNSNDTIYLSKINSCKFCWCDTLRIVARVQIDSIGSKEIVFLRNCNGFTSEHGGTFDIDESINITKYEIWNLDSKKMIFDAVSSYKSDFNKFQAYSTPKHKKGKESYSYEFKINANGQITISNVKTHAEVFTVQWKTVKKKGKNEKTIEEVPYPYTIKPDRQEGVYKYVNGEYIKE